MADVGDVERLVVLLEAKITDFEKNLAKASGTATKNYGKMRSESKSATGAMEQDMVRANRTISAALASTAVKIGEVGKEFATVRIEALSEQFLALGKSILLQIAAFGTLEGAVEGIKSQIERADTAGKLAQSLGLSVEALTQLEHAAKMADVPVDTLSTALRTLDKNALAFADGSKKGAAVAFEALGINVKAANGELKPAGDLLSDIAEKFSKMKNSAEKTALAQQLFGRSGAALIPLLNEGRDGLREMADESDRLGLTISTKAAAGAAELADKVKLLHDRFTGLVSRVTQDTIPAIEGAVDAISDLFDEAGSGGPILDLLEGGIRDVSSLIVQLTGTAQQCADIFTGLGQVFEEFSRGDYNPVDAFKVLDGYIQQATADGAAADAKARAILAGTYVPPAGDKPPAGGRGGGDDTGGPLDLMGNAKDRAKEALKEQKEAVDELRKSMEQATHTAEDFANTFVGDLMDGKSVTESLSDALGDLSKQLIQMAMNKAIESLFSNLLGAAMGGSTPIRGYNVDFSGLPGHADGTANTGGSRGKPAGIVHGQEAVIPLPSGGRVPVQVTGSAAPIIYNHQTEIINNAAADTKVTQQTTQTAGGVRQQIVVEKMVAGAFRNGSAAQRAAAGVGAIRKRG